MGNMRYTIVPLLICQLNPGLRQNTIIQHLKQLEMRPESNPELAGENGEDLREKPRAFRLVFFLENIARWDSLINSATQPDMLIKLWGWG